jgi:D-alanine-D-alanine ligase
MSKKNVLWFGGESEERLVSVASAQNLVQHFDFHEIYFWSQSNQVYAVLESELLSHQNPFLIPFEPKSQALVESGYQREFLESFQGSRVYLAFHGGRAENGTLQKHLEIHGLYFTGSGSLASQIAFNKALAKLRVQEAGGRVAQGQKINLMEMPNWKDVLKDLLQKWKSLVIKPNESGSSFGLYFVSNEDELYHVTQKMEASISTFSSYLCEERVLGRELTVGFYSTPNDPKGGKVLPPSEVLLDQNRNFDYQGKYMGSGVKEVTPADLPLDLVNKAQKLSELSHYAVGAYGYSRTDMILTESGEMVFLEINTLPGMTKASFIPQQLDVEGVTLKDFIGWQMELAELRYQI